MNALIAIKRKAKSAYHSGGLRNRIPTPMKRKSAVSEPDASTRPNKSPKGSQISLAVDNAEVEPEQEAQTKVRRKQGKKPSYKPTVTLRRSERLRNQAKSGHPSSDVGNNDTSEPIAYEAASVQPDQEAKRLEQPAFEPSPNEVQLDQDELDSEDRELSEVDSQRQEADRQTEDPVLDWEQQQALRTPRYVRFCGEDDDDYTYGPSRVILCHDGVSSKCACVLLTLDFTAKVRDALREQREFEKLKTETRRRKIAGIRFDDEIEGETASHRARLRGLERDEDPEANADQQEALQEELRILEMMLARSKSDRQHNQVFLDAKAETLRWMQAKANAYLEEAFVVANLLEPAPDEPDDPIEKPDLQEEYRKFCQAQDTGEYERSFQALDTSRYRRRAPSPTPEEQAKQHLVEAFHTMHDRLQQAHEDFDSKERSREQAKVAFKNAIMRGEYSEADMAEEFDLPWLKRFQEITRELIDAEEAFSMARANAREAGLVIKSQDEESYCSSIEPKATNQLEKAPAPEKPIFVNSNPKVSHWLDCVSETLSLTYEEEDGEADKSDEDAVFFNESVSVVAKGLEREQIDQWEHKGGEEVCVNTVYQEQESETGTPGDETHESATREYERWSKLRGVKELLAVWKEPRHL